MLAAFLICLSTTAVAEMGDRTQLLALVLAARFRRPWAILCGVSCATLLSNLLAALVGEHLGRFLTPTLLDALVGASMLGMGLWALKPDRAPAEAGAARGDSAFLAAGIAIFIAELGDKTQLATLALAAAYARLVPVVAGATLGMLLANAPVILLGHAFSRRLPLRLIHAAASLLFIALGAWFLWQAAHHRPA